MSDVLDLMWGELQDELSRQKAEAEVVLARSERSETAGGIESSTFANLPYHANGAHDGDLRFVTDACKASEGVGTGTGTPCYFDEGTDTWKRVEDDAAPLSAGGSGGGGVASVTASAPLASSGGANPNISLTGQIPGSQIDLASLAGAAYTTAQHSQDILHSTGWISGGAITNNGNGTISVAAGEGLIRASNSDVAQLLTCHWPQSLNMALTDVTENYLYVDYNGGSPALAISTVNPTDYNTRIHLADIYRNGTDLHIFSPAKHTVGNAASLTMREFEEVMPFANASGGEISATGTRNIGITAGAWWNGLTRFTTAAFDSSGADRFETYYRNGGGGWTEVAAQSQINNTQYDNGSGALATLTANRYAVHWVYLGADGDVRVQFGQGDYTLANAQNAPIPTPPPELLTDSRLIAKIIIQKSAAAFFSVESAISKVFTPASVSDHNGLSGLQGGTTNEYYHLTSAQNLLLSGNQTANTVLAGPSSGAAAAPAYRALVAADIPAGGGGGLTVKNTSGGNATANDLGYIDANGEYKTTTTEALDANWCVVLTGGANNADIVVARAGRVTVVLNASCSAGDYLITSTTAGRAKPTTIMQPAIFARALTANAGGAGGTCSAILLCNTKPVALTNANYLYYVAAHGNSNFVSTINGAPSATSVVYGAVSAGAANVIVPATANQLLMARLWNTTRNTYRLIVSVNTGTSTITTVSTADAWANGDTITIESRTVTSGLTTKMIDLDFAQQTVIPPLARVLKVLLAGQDTGAANKYHYIHPFKAYSLPDLLYTNGMVVSVFNNTPYAIPIIGGVIDYMAEASGANTSNTIMQLLGYDEAVP